MPEYPEVEGEQYVITRGKGSGLLPRAYGQLQFFAQVVPLCLSLGTKHHHFESITANSDDYTLHTTTIEVVTLNSSRHVHN